MPRRSRLTPTIRFWKSKLAKKSWLTMRVRQWRRRRPRRCLENKQCVSFLLFFWVRGQRTPIPELGLLMDLDEFSPKSTFSKCLCRDYQLRPCWWVSAGHLTLESSYTHSASPTLWHIRDTHMYHNIHLQINLTHTYNGNFSLIEPPKLVHFTSGGNQVGRCTAAKSRSPCSCLPSCHLNIRFVLLYEWLIWISPQ